MLSVETSQCVDIDFLGEAEDVGLVGPGDEVVGYGLEGGGLEGGEGDTGRGGKVGDAEEEELGG